MAQYLISYDLHHRRVYTGLHDLMSQWKAVRLHKSTWLANLTGPASAIRNLLVIEIDADGSVAVIELKPASQWATVRTEAGAAEWLSAYIDPAG